MRRKQKHDIINHRRDRRSRDVDPEGEYFPGGVPLGTRLLWNHFAGKARIFLPPARALLAHDDVEGQLPQPEGFVGLAITLDLLYTSLKTINTQELSDHARLNHYSLDVSILGQGASFTVLKRLGQCTGLEIKETNDEDTSSDASSSATGKSSSSSSDPHEVVPMVMKVPRVSFDRNGNPHEVEQLKALLSEIQVMSALALQCHSNIIRLLEIQWDHPKLDRERLGPTLYVEYAEFGTLTDYLTLDTPIA